MMPVTILVVDKPRDEGPQGAEGTRLQRPMLTDKSSPLAIARRQSFVRPTADERPFGRTSRWSSAVKDWFMRALPDSHSAGVSGHQKGRSAVIAGQPPRGSRSTFRGVGLKKSPTGGHDRVRPTRA